MSPSAAPSQTPSQTPDQTQGRSPAVSRGRPRDSDRTEAILDAATDLMHEVGWEGFRVQDVATRAGSGLATIYRRWPTKEALVADAMRHDAPLLTEPTGDPRADLHAMLTALATKMCGKGGSVIGVLAAARDHDELAQAVDEVMRTLVREMVSERIAQIVGVDNPNVSFLADAVPATLLLRAGIFEEDLDASAFADEAMALLDAVAS